MTDVRVDLAIYPEEGPKDVPGNDLHFDWLVLLRENLRQVFRDRDDVHVSADSYWYPVEGHPEESLAPDVYVVVGRPPGNRSSYLQWLEDGVAPLVTIEVLSPANYSTEGRRRLLEKLERAERYGVQEYIEIDPQFATVAAWERGAAGLVHQGPITAWRSERLGGVSFVSEGGALRVIGPDGAPFQTLASAKAAAEAEAERADAEAERADAERARADALEGELRRLRAAAAAGES